MSEARTILVTGGNGGLGRAIGAGFLEHDAECRVWLGVRSNRAAAGELSAEFPGRCRLVELDVIDPEAWRAAVGRIMEQDGRLDVLVNNAGVAAAGTVTDTSMEDWSWMIDTNLLGAVRMCRAFLPMMQKQRSGYVINVASAAGIVQSPGMASYNVAKAGMIALSETLRNEVRRFGIGVTVVCPSFFATNLMESYRGPKTGVRQMADKLMHRSRLDADDVADAVYRAMQKDELFVFAHNEARLAYHFKRLMPGVFYWSTERAAQKMFGDIVELEPSPRKRHG